MTHTVSDVVSDDTLNRIIQIESGGNPNIKARTSSALGLGQFLNATWMTLIEKYRPELLAHGKPAVLAMRTNPALSIEMLGWLCEESVAQLGAGWTDGDLYLSHFLGPSAARKVMRANPTSSVEPLVGPAAVNANLSILKGKTAGQVRAWAARKMSQASGHDWVAKFYNATSEIDDNAEPAKVEDDAYVDDPSVAPVDTTPHGKVNDQIANVQKSLVNMGYVEVGQIDGAWGGGTKAGIAAFLNDRGRDDLASDMSQGVLDEIAHAQLEGFKRPISEERASIKPKDLAKYNPTMQATLRTKAAGFWGGVTGFFALVGNAAASYFTTAWQYIKPVRDALDSVPVFVWIVLAIGVCIFLYWNANRAEKDTTQAFHERRLLR